MLDTFVECTMRSVKREYREARKVTPVREREREYLAMVYTKRRGAFLHEQQVQAARSTHKRQLLRRNNQKRTVECRSQMSPSSSMHSLRVDPQPLAISSYLQTAAALP